MPCVYSDTFHPAPKAKELNCDRLQKCPCWRTPTHPARRIEGLAEFTTRRPGEIIAKFGSANQMYNAVNQLQTRLYLN